MKNLFSSLILLFTIVSCSRTYNIPIDDYSLVPYKGNETLIFKSKSNGTDTIFLQGNKRFFSPVDQWSFPLKNAEHYNIISKRSDPSSPLHRYLDSLNLVTLFNDGETKIKIDFTAKNAWLYGNLIFTKKEFLQLKDTVLNVNGHRYDDVLIIVPNEIINGRSNAIKKLYWSKKKGIIRYEKMDSDYWELDSSF